MIRAGTVMTVLSHTRLIANYRHHPVSSPDAVNGSGSGPNSYYGGMSVGKSMRLCQFHTHPSVPAFSPT